MIDYKSLVQAICNRELFERAITWKPNALPILHRLSA